MGDVYPAQASVQGMRGLATPLGGNIPREMADRAGADARRLALPALAGDVLLIDNYLWHRSGAKTSPADQGGITVAYMPASTRCLRRKRAPRTFVRVFAPSSVR